MGLISSLLTAPYAPVRVVLWVGEVLRQQVEHELYDPKVIQRKMEQLEEAGAAGRLSEEEVAQQEQALLSQLIGPAGPTTATPGTNNEEG